MLAMLGAMAAVLVTWAIVGAAFIGIGLTWRDREGAFLAFWIGFARVLIILQFWNLFFPINGVTMGVILAWGWIALLARRRLVNYPTRGTLLALAIIAIWLANRAIGPGDAQDSGLYHFRAVRWATEFPVITGIGNLSAPLALNNVSFLYTALLEAGPWHGRSNHLANGLLLLALFGGIITSIARLLRGDRDRLPLDAYLLALLPIAVYLALGKDVSNPKTDLPVGFMTFVAGYAGLRFMLDRAHATPQLFTIALLSAAAICLKFSSIVVVTLIGLICLLSWIRLDRPAHWLRTVAGVLVIATLLLGPWIARNVIMSGYPLYPSKAIPIHVEWKVPEPAVDYLIGSIRDQAKAGLILWAYENLSKSPLRAYAPLIKPPFTERDKVQGLQWVRPWFFSLPITSPIEVVIPACVTAVACAFALRIRTMTALLLIPMLAGVAFWLWAGPEPRYGWQTLWALAAMSVALTAPSFNPNKLQRLVWIAFILTLPAIAYRAGVAALLRHGNPLATIPFLPPGPDHGFHPSPVQTFKTIRTRWGTEIFVPTDDDHPLTWDGPIPCTAWPKLDLNVRLRRPGDLRSGFMTDYSDAGNR